MRGTWSAGPAVAVAALSLLGPDAAVAQDAGGAPAWFHERMAELTRGSGRWLTDNRDYRSANEPYEEYGLAWRWGLGRQTVHGRLFGLVDGREVATFWEFLIYWDPARAEAVMLQVGVSGVVGCGALQPDGTSEQTFTDPAGGSQRVRHEETSEGDLRRSASFNWVDGAWVPRRIYVWRLAPP